MSLDAKDLIKVMRAAKKLGAMRFKTSELDIEFGPGEAAPTPEPQGETVVPPTDAELQIAEERAQLDENLDAADEGLAHMQVEDPVGFEQALLERQLEEIVGNDAGDSGASEGFGT